MFDSVTLNQLKAMRRKGQRRTRRHRDNKGAKRVEQADKPTGRVEARRIERVEEREQGVKPEGTGA